MFASSKTVNDLLKLSSVIFKNPLLSFISIYFRIGSETQYTKVEVDGSVGVWKLEVDQYYGRPGRYSRTRKMCNVRISGKSDFGMLASSVVDRGFGLEVSIKNVKILFDSISYRASL